jgi:YVTN family beta-propeller protein
MKSRALVVAALVCGCSQPVSTYSSASGSLGLSRDDALLYAADSDSDSLFVIDAKTESVVAQVKVGKQPERVLVGPDDTIYVSNRMGRSVSVIKRGEWTEAAKLATAVEPVGMSMSNDGKLLLVVNAATLDDAAVGSVMAFDARTLERRYEIKVGNEPRSIAVTGNKALVSLLKTGDVVTVDLDAQQVVRPKTDLFTRLNATALDPNSNQGGFGGSGGFDQPLPPGGVNGFALGIPKVHPRALDTLTVSPDGRQVFASALLSSDAVLPSTATETSTFPGAGGDGYGGGRCGAGSVTSPALLTFDSEGNAAATDATTCEGQRVEGQPAQILVSGNPALPIQGPSATAVDPTGAFIFVVGKESKTVGILPMSSSTGQTQGGDVTFAGGGAPAPEPKGGFVGSFGGGSVDTTVMVGEGPSGIALSRDGRTAWVHNAFDHSISRLERKDGVVQVVHEAQFTSDVLPQDVVEGRKLFFSASDERMSSAFTAIACASCHTEGREDGQVWNFTDGPRQTPSLAGRQLSKTAPFHWNGEFPGLTSFMAQTVNHRMGGSGVSAAMERQIAAFIDYQPAPDNPHRLAEPTEAQVRGAAVFQKAQCNGCHKSETLTDNAFYDVGTLVKSDDPAVLVDNPARLVYGGFNTPSLLGVARTAPYLHDGSAATLKERIMRNKTSNAHGITAQLTDAEVDDLVEFLKTL